MPKKDYYSILGVPKTATEDEIKSAYRKKAKEYHPDMNPNDSATAEKFKECNEAYSVIGDTEKRGKYDRGELDLENFAGGGGFSGFSGGGGFTDFFSDIFSMFSGGGSDFGGNAARASVGTDVRYEATLTFMEAVLGATKSVTFNRMEKCDTCGGTGARDANSVTTCDRCKGAGRVTYVQNTPFGRTQTMGACDKCGGTGKLIKDACRECGGKGLVSKRKVMNVRIPSGVEDGTALSLSGEGNAAKAAGGRSGSLILILRVLRSNIFTRERLNLYCEVPIPYTVAAAGGEVEIPTPQGVTIQKIPEGCANGETFRFRGKGVKSGVASGDLFVTVKVEVPTGLSKAQKGKLEDVEKELSLKNYPKRRAYLDEIKNLK